MTEPALLLVLAVAAGGAAPPVIVESATICPTAAEVDARLRVLLPPAGQAPPKRARVAAEAGALHVHLDAADGTALGDRLVPIEASCADRANVVAVVIAAWDAQQRAEVVQAPALPRPASPIDVVAAAPAPAPPRLTIEATAGPALTLTSDGLSPAAAAALSLWGARVGARLGLSGFLPRTQDVGVGSARWSRAGLSLELALRFGGSAGRLDAHAGAVAGLVTARGAGFEVDHTRTSLGPGLTAGVDASRAFGPLVLGLGVTGAAFAGQALVDASSEAAAPVSRALPRLQLTFDLHAGIAF